MAASDPTPDPATAALDRIRSELRTFGASNDDTAHLLAAVEAVLKLAGDAQGVRDYSGYETKGRPVGWNLDPAKIRETIASELAKGEATP